MKFIWENVKKADDGDCPDIQTHRAKVHGGWIVKIEKPNVETDNTEISVCFVPDPLHEWGI
jgi:hypothetical protein